MQVQSEGQESRRLGLILLNMGGPKDLDAVEPFLYNLFADPEIIVLPRLLRPFQKPLAWLISKFRTPSTSDMYQQIGNGSPILQITNQLGSEMEQYFSNGFDYIYSSSLMRYTPPRANEVIKKLQEEDINTIILFSQYPHYAESTSGSSFNEFYQELEKVDYNPKIIEVKEWGTEPEYLNWWKRGIINTFEKNDIPLNENTHLIFSAHGLPMRYVNAGEEYPNRILEAAELIMDKLGDIPKQISTHVSFQSQAGPIEWTKPYTDELIDEIAEENGEYIVIVPLGFVSNHVETLYEIDILYKDQAEDLGITNYYSIDVPDADPKYAKEISEMVKRIIGDELYSTSK